jgi:type VI protein secretion system component Hcp
MSDEKKIDQPAELSDNEIEQAVGGDGTQTTGKITPAPFVFTHTVDKASPSLS